LNSFTIDGPEGMCFDGSLYVCSQKEKKIYKLNEDFSSLEVFEIDANPTQIKVRGEKAIVHCDNEIRVYDSNRFSDNFIIINDSGNIEVVDSFILVVNEKWVSVYNLDGKLIERIRKIFTEMVYKYYSGMCFSNNQLVMTTNSDNIYRFQQAYFDRESEKFK
jgi:uncharacterized pyridoxamine 5'-phosphate oxidase family protein